VTEGDEEAEDRSEHRGLGPESFDLGRHLYVGISTTIGGGDVGDGAMNPGPDRRGRDVQLERIGRRIPSGSAAFAKSFANSFM